MFDNNFVNEQLELFKNEILKNGFCICRIVVDKVKVQVWIKKGQGKMLYEIEIVSNIF